MTIAMLFLVRHTGTYYSRGVLRTRINAWLDNECRWDLSGLSKERDMEFLVDVVVRSGGVTVGK